MNARHLQVVERDHVHRPRKLNGRREIEVCVAERRKMLGELVEREGLGQQQLALDDRRAA